MGTDIDPHVYICLFDALSCKKVVIGYATPNPPKEMKSRKWIDGNHTRSFSWCVECLLMVVLPGWLIWLICALFHVTETVRMTRNPSMPSVLWEPQQNRQVLPHDLGTDVPPLLQTPTSGEEASAIYTTAGGILRTVDAYEHRRVKTMEDVAWKTVFTDIPARPHAVQDRTSQWMHAVSWCLRTRPIHYRAYWPITDYWFGVVSGIRFSRVYGFVIPLRSGMTLTPRFLTASAEMKTHVMIHECTHLMLNTKDRAYQFEKKYNHLRGMAAITNADSVSLFLESLLYPETPVLRL